MKYKRDFGIQELGRYLTVFCFIQTQNWICNVENYFTKLWYEDSEKSVETWGDSHRVFWVIVKNWVTQRWVELILCLLEESPNIPSLTEVSRPLEGKSRHRKKRWQTIAYIYGQDNIASLSGSKGIGRGSLTPDVWKLSRIHSWIG